MGKEELEELRMIKKLLMYQLIRDGANSIDLSMATGIPEGSIRVMFPMKKLKKRMG